jgi:acetyltransferase-like isoleucine patch superfamily enzyme
MSAVESLRRWAKSGRSPAAVLVYSAARRLRGWSMPVIPGVHRVLYAVHKAATGTVSTLSRVVWYTPLFKSRLEGDAPGLFLYGGLPLILGRVQISMGRGCRVSGQTTIAGRAAGDLTPRLVVGSNVDIGWQTTVAVGRTVRLGDNVRIAGRAFLAGYPGHPLDPEDRAAGLPDTEDQVGDIVLEDGVWLATGVTVSAGVRIGRGAVVAAGSVVTSDIPPGVLAAGVPARVIRPLTAAGDAL